jgi:Flp pilus assembly protein TadD
MTEIAPHRAALPSGSLLRRLTGSYTTLAIMVSVLTLVVLSLGGAILAVKLRPAPMPSGTAAQEVLGWEKAVQISPNDASARTALGIAFLREGRTSEAEQSFEKALSLDAKQWEAAFQLGQLYTKSDPGKAEKLLAQAGSAAPAGNKVGPLVALGNLQMARGDLNGARATFEAAVTDQPVIIEAHLGLAQVDEKLHDPQDALEQYREASQYDPSNQDIANAIARLQKNAG